MRETPELEIDQQGIHQQFEAQVEQTPNAIAVVCEDKQLTYQELNNRANQLAHYLQALDVKPDVLVGICLERSLEMVVGLLGILKAGGAYVPLDPSYPKERLSFMLEETQVPVMLTQNRLVKELPQQTIQMICLDTDWETIARESEENLVSEVTPQQVAYVMYTSGSTGKPKAVQIPHTRVSDYVQSINNVLQIQTTDIYLHTASFSFSSSVRQLMVPLSQGSKIILASYEQTKNPLSLFQIIQKQGVTVFDTVQSVWRHGLQALESLDKAFQEVLIQSQLRLVLFSGGLLPCQLLKKVRSAVGNQPQIVNIYGQTETIGVCAYPIPAEFDKEQGYVPVGHPLAHTQAYILDDHLQLVPLGEPGELHVAGASLALGYLNRPDLTAEKFISNPFSNESASQLYKTGDVARYLPDGTLEILGRTDYQVTIREMRVELGEIELAIAQNPSIRETVVIATEDVLGDTRLIAYVVPKLLSAQSNQTALIKDLRSLLKEKLPDYMVPSTFVMLEALPLTPNGKIDRTALPAPDLVRQQPKETFVAPHDEIELQLTQIWQKVLGVQPIGVKDNFFELGGHSLSAVRMFAEVEPIAGRNFPLATLLEAPTIEQLATVIRHKEWSAPWSSLVAIQPGSSKPPLFCIHPVGGNVLEYLNLVRYLGSEQPIYGLQAQGLDGKQTPLNRVKDMAAYYIKEIRTLQPEGPYFLAGYSFGGLVAFEMAQQLHAQGQKVALLALCDTY
ncbi:MAG TPA: non-ribosomal peptide synthetase, partial [Cyanobacteria bacterium UBA8543]|nr:non-ribosomal peptide synthetase [Cyanobacteria bacterium UBA8543]